MIRHVGFERPALALLAVTCIVCAVLMPGCATPDEGRGATKSGSPDPALSLRHGMSGQQVEDLMGKPKEIREVRGAAFPVEIWIYRRALGTRVNSVSPTMIEVPWIDPITGELKMLKAPEMSEQRIELVEELSLFLASGQLVEVRRAVTHDRMFTR